MVDAHDNRAKVSIGGVEYELVASKLAERIYGDRFRNDTSALGESGVTKPVLGEDGKPTGETYPVTYSGRLKLDIAISAAAPVGPTADIPDQVVAAAWAMTKAAGSTEDDWDTFLVNWLKLPSNAQEDLDLYEAVCVDRAERAFFRDLGRPRNVEEPDQGEEG
jgi:hypothetical protein